MIETTLYVAIRQNKPPHSRPFHPLTKYASTESLRPLKSTQSSRSLLCDIYPRSQPSTQVECEREDKSTCCASSAVGAKTSTRGLPGLALPCTSASSSSLSPHTQQSTSKKAIFNPVMTVRTWMESTESVSLGATVPGNTGLSPK